MKQSPPSYRGADCGLAPRALANCKELPYSRAMRDMIRHPSRVHNPMFLTLTHSFSRNLWVNMLKGDSNWVEGKNLVMDHAMNSLSHIQVLHFEVRFSESDKMLGWYAIGLNKPSKERKRKP